MFTFQKKSSQKFDKFKISFIHVFNISLLFDFLFVLFFPCKLYFKICIVYLAIFIYHITFFMNKLHFDAFTLFPFKRQERKFSEWRVSMCTRSTDMFSFKCKLKIDRVFTAVLMCFLSCEQLTEFNRPTVP